MMRNNRYVSTCTSFHFGFMWRATKRYHALLLSPQIMVALRFYASGNFKTVTGHLYGISKAGVLRIVNALLLT